LGGGVVFFQKKEARCTYTLPLFTDTMTSSHLISSFSKKIKYFLKPTFAKVLKLWQGEF